MGGVLARLRGRLRVVDVRHEAAARLRELERSAPKVRVHPRPDALTGPDEEDMCMLVRVVLSKAHVEVIAEAIDGQEALDAVHRLDPPPVPTALILDNRMPGMTGLEVAARVLEHTPSQPIVLFSAFLTEEIERQAEALGIRACVSKTDIDRLPQVIAELASQ
jgi:CheY-like chemotaxis protein